MDDDRPVVAVVFHPVSRRVMMLGPLSCAEARDWWAFRHNRLPAVGVRMAIVEVDPAG